MLVQFPLDRIVAGLNNRVNSGFSPASLQSLADSLREHGQVQPIVLRRAWRDKGGAIVPVQAHSDAWETAYRNGEPDAVAQICAGERRTRAAKLAGWATIEAKLQTLTDRAALSVMFVENGDRVDIDPIDEGLHYAGMHEQYGYSDQEIAAIAGRSVERVRDRIALTRLYPDLQKLVRDGQLPMRHALLLSQLSHARQAFAKRVFTAGRLPPWSVFQGMVNEHLIAQAGDDQLDLFEVAELCRRQAEEIITAGKKGRAARIKRLPVPAHLQLRLKTGPHARPLANQAKAWADTLPDMPREAVYALIEALIDIGRLPVDEKEW